MDKMKYPRGLVRYDTENGLDKHLTRNQLLRRIFRPRVLIYTGVLVLICLAVGISIATRSPFRVDVIRDRGTLSRQVDDGYVENVYRLQIMNASEVPQHYSVQAEGLPGLRLSAPVSVDIAPIESHWISVALRVPPETASQLKPGAHEIHFVIERSASPSEPALTLKEKSSFMLPR